MFTRARVFMQFRSCVRVRTSRKERGHMRHSLSRKHTQTQTHTHKHKHTHTHTHTPHTHTPHTHTHIQNVIAWNEHSAAFGPESEVDLYGQRRSARDSALGTQSLPRMSKSSEASRRPRQLKSPNSRGRRRPQSRAVTSNSRSPLSAGRRAGSDGKRRAGSPSKRAMGGGGGLGGPPGAPGNRSPARDGPFTTAAQALASSRSPYRLPVGPFVLPGPLAAQIGPDGEYEIELGENS